MLHPDVQKVVDYPVTPGDRYLKYRLENLTEADNIKTILTLAKMIDKG